MGDLTKLNLGCGLSYRPGYLNIDKHQLSIADVSADVDALPFDSNSVSTIEAIQLLEHFDLVHSKYVLSEWFRVLKPEGTLVIETPDLRASVKRVLSSKRDDKEAAIQWLYGIDSPGLRHKGVFTRELLEEIVTDIGFEAVRWMPAITHTYAPGMRLECRKPKVPGSRQFTASLRGRIKRRLGIDDSFVLVPLEREQARLRTELGSRGALNKDGVRKVASVACVWNPSIAISFLDECIDAHVLPEPELERYLDSCRYLADVKFHERAFTLWMKSRKGSGSEEEFESFTEKLSKTVLEIFDRPESRERILEYVSSLEPIPITVFDLCLIKQEARSVLNVGILKFHRGDLRGAVEQFNQSVRMDPGNPLAHWNLARIGIATGISEELILKHYSEAMSLIRAATVKRKLEKEMTQLRSDDRESASALPVSEFDLTD